MPLGHISNKAIMHIRDQRNSNNFHGYKKIDLIINSKFMDPNKHTTKELHHMDLQETIVLRIKRERGSHLATNYEPAGLQRTTHASSERHNGGAVPHPRWCLEWVWWVWTLRRLDEYFVDVPRVSGFFGVFIEKRGGLGGTRGGHNPPGHAWAS